MTAVLSGTNGLLQAYDYQVPTTGFSYTFAAGVQTLIMNPAGTLATGTITMPAAPADGMVITFSSTKAITALTVNANTGQTINNAVTTLAVGQSASYVYRTASTAWFPFSDVSAAPVPAQIQPISASVASNALTISASALSLSFRSTTLGSGTVTTVSGTPSNLVVPSTATLGTVSAVQSRLVVIALNNAGTIELAVANIAGSVNFDETTLLTTTAISTGSTSASVVYSTTARTSVAFRVIGYIESTQATAGTWATAPSTIQGSGGQALTAMSSIGYGQIWQDVSGSRSGGTTYYNTTGKPIMVNVWQSDGESRSGNMQVNGVTVSVAITHGAGGGTSTMSAIVPPGASYVANGSLSTWVELR